MMYIRRQADNVNQTNDMFEKLRQRFPLPEDRFEGQMRYWHRMEVPAGTVLIREAETARKIFLIEKGCIRAWMNNHGREITFQFFFEHEAVSSSESFRKNIPSFFTLETIEPCVLYWIHKKDWELLMKEISRLPGIPGKGMELMLDRQYQYMRQFISFLNDSPEQRYINLIKEKPHILRRVPLQYIATYLGITPVSLSRIRKRVSSKEKKLSDPT